MAGDISVQNCYDGFYRTKFCSLRILIIMLIVEFKYYKIISISSN